MFFNKSKKLLKEKEEELENALSKLLAYEQEFKEVIDKNSFLAEKNLTVEAAERKLHDLNDTYQKGLILHKTLEEEIAVYEDNLEINSYGLHKPRFSFDTSERFKHELELNYERQKASNKG